MRTGSRVGTVSPGESAGIAGLFPPFVGGRADTRPVSSSRIGLRPNPCRGLAVWYVGCPDATSKRRGRRLPAGDGTGGSVYAVVEKREKR